MESNDTNNLSVPSTQSATPEKQTNIQDTFQNRTADRGTHPLLKIILTAGAAIFIYFVVFLAVLFGIFSIAYIIDFVYPLEALYLIVGAVSFLAGNVAGILCGVVTIRKVWRKLSNHQLHGKYTIIGLTIISIVLIGLGIYGYLIYKPNNVTQKEENSEETMFDPSISFPSPTTAHNATTIDSAKSITIGMPENWTAEDLPSNDPACSNQKLANLYKFDECSTEQLMTLWYNNTPNKSSVDSIGLTLWYGEKDWNLVEQTLMQYRTQFVMADFTTSKGYKGIRKDETNGNPNDIGVMGTEFFIKDPKNTNGYIHGSALGIEPMRYGDFINEVTNIIHAIQFN